MSNIELIPYSPALKNDFYEINREWLEDMFQVEPCDEEILRNPQEVILDRGGEIWFVKAGDMGVVGTCALLKSNDTDFELTKMAVLKKARGFKAGEALLRHVIERARQQGIENLYLLTNSKCVAAIHLYRKNGFVDDIKIMEKYGKKYERCDTAMRHRPLKKTKGYG